MKINYYFLRNGVVIDIPIRVSYRGIGTLIGASLATPFLIILLLLPLGLKAEKHALLVGVGDYPTSGGWQDLAAVNDVIHMQEALKLHGFLDDNMISLVNQEASKANIVAAFEQLRAKIQVGDIVVIHLSGHGQQIPDNNGDEPDQLDEAFVPYDSPKLYQAGSYEGEQLLLDDEINSFTYAIREKLGSKGQLIFLLDACHSGTGNRGSEKARGTDIIMAPENYEALIISTESYEGQGYDNSEHLAPMGSFFGSSAHELNYQVVDDQLQPIGSLSYTVATLLAELQEPISFQDFFRRIETRMRSLVLQHPQWDGPTTALLFDQHHFSFNPTYSATFQSDNQIRGQVGTMRGVHRGSKVEVYSTNPARGSIIAKGTVIQTDLNQSIIQLDTSVDLPPDEELLVRIPSLTKTSLKSRIDIQLAPNSSWQSVADNLQSTPFVEAISDNAHLFLKEDPIRGLLQLLTKEGVLLVEVSERTKEQAFYELIKYIKAYNRGNFLRGYENTDAAFRFSVSMIPTEAYTDNSNLPPALGGTVPIGTEIYIAIKNEGSKAAYFSLLDIEPDNDLNVLIPVESLGHMAKDFYLQPGEVYVTDYSLTIGGPVGEETLKLICTNQPIAISSIIQQNGVTTRSNSELHPFEQTLIYSFQQQATSGITVTEPELGEMGITTLNFRIVPKD